MCSYPHQRGDTSCVSDRATAARNLVSLLTALFTADARPSSATCPQAQLPGLDALPTGSCREILSAIQALVPALTPNSPIFATFHDGQVHDPLGGGSYAFQADVVAPILLALMNDEVLSNVEKRHLADERSDEANPQNCPATNHEPGTRLPMHIPTRPIVIHAGVQPNNSPHVGTLVVFCYAFSFARGIRDRMQAMVVNTNDKPPPVSVEITFVDTAPVKGEGVEIDGIQYQRSYRDVPGAMNTYMADYEEVFHLLSTWSDIPFTTAFQCELFSHPTIPPLLRYIVAHHDLLGRQISPKFGTLALRAACPIPGCALAEKHGRLNVYDAASHQNKNVFPAAHDATITFHCPYHGSHTICASEPADVARLEANAPARNLIRSMSHLLDTRAHNVRITGADYAGMYQEMFLYRPLAAWSAATGLAVGRTPHILYAPLIVDWSGAKLSKALYVREGGYEAMKLFGTDGLCSFARLKSWFGGNGSEGLRRIWEEVQRWLEDPRKLFRTFSLEYLQMVIMEEHKWK
ncbi:hypothetical protein NW761_014980 [Fusarium oxysporum]|nr:hypothetical protein NW758_015063 [Fusarium oxysporum]KAJ4072387.1 hypothetical protein NW761_014980 [Fusarium oxysporum]KAJ4079639.1 hypothetical protein NW769_015098 [Fusarium oxysporum]KAJ4213131.1 hypothetical protein NW760_015172 [Fusarium oxysporum]KAJ4264090.1 hypothetical protein NW764_016005 [Fusarium oxysporum]